MSKTKVLNLYACLGGNRYKWNEVTDIEVTAVELDPIAAQLYQERFPNDRVIVADAHEYLRLHYDEYDFIWSSPPCPTHSRMMKIGTSSRDLQYPDMKLYQEIIFLDSWFKGKYCVENVIPYYTPLIPGQRRGRHIYWCNFKLPNILSDRTESPSIRDSSVKELSKYHDYDFSKYRKAGGKQRLDKMARNLVEYNAGKTIFEYATNCITLKKTTQLTIL